MTPRASLFGILVQTGTFGVCGAVAYMLRHETLVIELPYVGAIVAGMAAYAALTMATMRSVATPIASRVIGVAMRLALVGLLLAAFGYYLKASETYSRLWSAYWFALAMAALVVMELRGVSPARRVSRVLLVGPSANTVAMRGRLEADHGSDGISVVGEMPVTDAMVWLERQALADAGAAVDEIIIVGAMPTAEERECLVRSLHGNPIGLRYCVEGAAVPGDGLGGLATVSLVTVPSPGGLALKRGIDVFCSATLLALALPLLLLIAAAIRAEGPGPILFTQRRLGMGGRSFLIYKFRSMVPVAATQADVPQALSADARITRVGGVLRLWGLDELPQLINVLKGDMSLVGPRPHAFAHDVRWSAEIDGYSERLRMRPGITGLAQVKGCRGETRHSGDMACRLALDLEYIRSWSPLLDLKILLATAPAILAEVMRARQPAPASTVPPPPVAEPTSNPTPDKAQAQRQLDPVD
ncbi:MAG TPA: exopolysaccharide biosynthesis polyprenyl glycosylphosphotransferase [Magnetospirillum sp.]|nr:exopolysaccharide biosynthesis polyprenyl glycosylphosphotransferase [Magnetospirillum sp.]